MDTVTAKKILTKKEPANLYDVVQPALECAELRDLLAKGSSAKDETYRYNCVRVLFRALAQRPDLFYIYWDHFVSGLDSLNGFHRSVTAQAVAYLTSVDQDCKLDLIFKRYLNLFDDSKVMVARYFIQTIDLVARARPDLQDKIITLLLGIDNTHHTVGHKELLKADIIQAFDRLFESLSPKQHEKALAFVETQLMSKSLKTRKAAKEFQKRHL